MGWRMWTRFMWLWGLVVDFVNSHITGMCHKIGVSTSRATVNLVNKTNLVHSSLYVYFYSLHVSGNHVPIIRRNNYHQYDTWYLSLCVGDSLVCMVG
jgi:hypothetical protein